MLFPILYCNSGYGWFVQFLLISQITVPDSSYLWLFINFHLYLIITIFLPLSFPVFPYYSSSHHCPLLFFCIMEVWVWRVSSKLLSLLNNDVLFVIMITTDNKPKFYIFLLNLYGVAQHICRGNFDILFGMYMWIYHNKFILNILF